MMQVAVLNDMALHYRYRHGAGVPIVFLNSLGTDLRIWDGVVDALGLDAPILCVDKRGHGLSDDAPISMPALVKDVAELMDHLQLPPALICGVSVGGMIAQGLALKRPDLAAGLILCCTGAKIGNAEGWNERIKTVQTIGIAVMADAILERWFSTHFRTKRTTELAGYRNMLIRTSAGGYAGVCSAIRDTDFAQQSRNISIPTHCIAGADDLATPPSLVQSLAALIPDATFQMIEQCGHLPCIEAPEAVADTLRQMHMRLA